VPKHLLSDSPPSAESVPCSPAESPSFPSPRPPASERRDSNNELAVTLVEPDRTDGLASAEGYVTEYIRKYVSEPTPARAARHADATLLFLLRNLPEPVRASAAAASAAAAAAATAAAAGASGPAGEDGGKAAAAAGPAPSPAQAAAAAAADVEALRKVVVLNGLECKISCSTCKVRRKTSTLRISCLCQRSPSSPHTSRPPPPQPFLTDA
jgi:hypothetical protein